MLEKIVSCSKDNTIRVWDYNQPEMKLEIKEECKLVAIHRYSYILSTGSLKDISVKVWNADTGSLLRVIPNFSQSPIVHLGTTKDIDDIILIDQMHNMVILNADYQSLAKEEEKKPKYPHCLSEVKPPTLKFSCLNTVFDQFGGLTET